MRKVIILFVFYLATINISFAQLQGQAKIDSLKAEIPKAKQDTNHVNLLHQISFAFNSIDPDKGIEYGEKGLELAQKLSWRKGEAYCYNSLGANNDAKSDYTKALEYYHKALKINTGTGDLKMMIYNLHKIGDVYHKQSKYSEAENYFKQVIDVIKNDELIIEKATTFKRLAFVHEEQGDFTKAMDYHYKALRIFEAEDDKRNIAGELHNIANNYLTQSNYPKALDYFQQALKINEEIGNFRWKAYNLASLAIVYSEVSEHSKAVEFNQQALELFEEMDNQYAIAGLLHNIGANYTDIFEHEKAKDFYLRAMKMNEEMGNLHWLTNNLDALGNVYKYLADYSKAIKFFERALSISEEIGDKSGIATSLGNIGYYYLSLAQDSIINKSENKVQLLINKDINLANSIKYLQRSVSLHIETGERIFQSYSLFNLSRAYELKGNYKKAFEAFKEYKTLQDSVFSMDKQKEIANLEAKRENELKDAEIIILNTENKAQQFQSYLLGGGAIVLLGAFGIAFLRFREKKKLSDKLALQNAEIENQKNIVESQKAIVEEQKFVLQEKNDHIYSSVQYAATIQQAILPWDSIINSAFSDILIFYKPKDIVSGDSYWFQEVEGVKYLAVIDCTGHGIPGAMLTVIASTALDDAVLGKRLNDPAEILTYINEKVTEVLNQKLAENNIRDGMEVALIAIHQDKITFSGAGRPLYLKNGTLEIIKTDKRGIAGSTKNDEYQFNSVEIEKAENITLYLTTDGYADQMNEDGKKFSTRRFLALIESIADAPISEQTAILEKEFNNHRCNREQIDDITIIGVRI
ncbi:MAG: hypothetical protein CVV22_10735 [Ignavibacteriae bacterium HGW-Ignavibacteriae-1]|jgi:tetratricopeptide (TPR) repeat protein|nr:MAG: hypothetical protein CVV22_10735 [Ignavibacteriae bacterium HGW-Ignavibacteriae-1]